MTDSRDQNKFVVRLPEGMRERIAEAAKANNRSMNSEIVSRLEQSFKGVSIDPADFQERRIYDQENLMVDLDRVIKSRVNKYIYEALKKAGVNDLFDEKT